MARVLPSTVQVNGRNVIKSPTEKIKQLEAQRKSEEEDSEETKSMPQLSDEELEETVKMIEETCRNLDQATKIPMIIDTMIFSLRNLGFEKEAAILENRVPAAIARGSAADVLSAAMFHAKIDRDDVATNRRRLSPDSNESNYLGQYFGKWHIMTLINSPPQAAPGSWLPRFLLRTFGVISALATTFVVTPQASAQNLLSNPGFELGTTGLTQPGWEYSSDGVFIKSTGHTGQSSIGIRVGTTTRVAYIYSTNIITAISNEVFRLSAWIKTVNFDSSDFVLLGLVNFDNGGNFLSLNSDETHRPGNTDWVQITETITATNARVARVSVRLMFLSSDFGPNAATVYFDDISLTRVPHLPATPVATAATGVTTNAFTANWSGAAGATDYQIDVSRNSTFSSFVPGYNNLSVGNGTNRTVTGLSPNTTYYYRVRAFNTAGTSAYSSTIGVSTLLLNYTITVNASPVTGGTVSGGGTFPGGSSRTVTATANSGYTFASWTENGTVVSAASNYTFTLNGGRNLVANFSSSTNSASGMALIAAGSFTMGDTFGEGFSNERPTHTVNLSPFLIDRVEVTLDLWNEVKSWAIAHGYSFDFAGIGRDFGHPVVSLTWHDAVKWCNARSEKEGRTPAYYTSTDQVTLYRTGRIDVRSDWIKWNTGYRLPTEAEWEKAARGGLNSKRFPLGDTIAHSQANYFSTNSFTYDISPTRGYHPVHGKGSLPYDSPVASLLPNGYGVYDMAGNVWEWCWDRWDAAYYSSAPGSDPHGPNSGTERVIRGGSWSTRADGCRVAFRTAITPATADIALGFRSVLPLVAKGDLNGDQKPDILFQDNNGFLAYWPMDGIKLGQASLLSPDNPRDLNWRMAATGDLNSDGQEDILFQHTDGRLVVWFMRRTTQIGWSFLDDPRDRNWRVVSAADMDDDNKIDLIFQHTDGSLAVWYLDGIRLRTGQLFPKKPDDTRWRVVGIGDFNRDGRSDLLFQHTDGTLAVWFLDGVNLIQSTLLSPANSGAGWRAVGVADRNQDGKPDVLFQHTNLDLAVWFMNGTTLQTASFLGPRNPGGTWKAMSPK